MKTNDLTFEPICKNQDISKTQQRFSPVFVRAIDLLDELNGKKVSAKTAQVETLTPNDVDPAGAASQQ